MLKELFSSKTRVKLLTYFLLHPDEKFYIRQLEKLINEPVGALQRELPKLTKIGLLNSVSEGKLKYFFVNKKSSIYEELKRIILKTTGLGDQLKKFFKNEKDIKYTFIYGSVANNTEDIKSDIDLMVIGNIDEIKLHKRIKEIESSISRTINYNLMSIKEFKKRLKNKDSFLLNILNSSLIDILGNLDEIREAYKRK